MRALHSNHIIYVMLLLLVLQPDASIAQALEPDSIEALPNDSIELLVNNRYHKYLAKRRERWNKLMPSLGVVQYAGNIGFISAGVGWDYGKNERWETQCLLGFLPAFVMSDDMFTLTLRENFVPWQISCSKQTSVSPAVFTFSVNTVMNHEFWYKESDRFGESGYYSFSSALRFHLGFGSRFNLHIPENFRRHSDQISIYYEVSTYDLAIISAVPNRHHRLRDLIALGFGFRYKFF